MNKKKTLFATVFTLLGFILLWGGYFLPNVLIYRHFAGESDYQLWFNIWAHCSVFIATTISVIFLYFLGEHVFEWLTDN